ncbi:restriction endonuclease [Streptomyces avidinii]|uniref:restriction endonuclease n=1 Tax=Streptomyces avidinii TaxID=1895 RepID=UPI0037A28AC3
MSGEMNVERRIEELYAKYEPPRWAHEDDPDLKPGRHLDLHTEFQKLLWVMSRGFRGVEKAYPRQPAPTIWAHDLAYGAIDLALLRRLVDFEAEVGIAVPLVQVLMREVLDLPCRSRRDRAEMREIIANTWELKVPDMRRVDDIERTLLHACSPVLQLDGGLFEPSPKLIRLYVDHVSALYELRDEVVFYANGWADTLDAIVNLVRCMAPVATPMAEVDVLHHAEFERLVADLLDRDGYRVVRSGGGAGDQGADVLAMDEFGRYLMVQCKHFTGGSGSVGQPVAQHLYGGAMATHPSTLAVLVTNGKITGGAKVWAEEGARVRLVGRGELYRWTEEGENIADVIKGTGPA